MKKNLYLVVLLLLTACVPAPELNDTTVDDTIPVESESESKTEPRIVPSDSPFVVVTDLDPTILTNIRYAGHDNFMGRPFDGYLQPVAILTRQAAEALVKANAELSTKGIGILIYDAYRPKRAVDDIMQWAYNPADTLTKSNYYPTLTKLQIRQQGYISKHSRHSMGSTVDLTLIQLDTQEPLDMGSPFDLFSDISHFRTKQITAQQQANRQLLRTIMSRHGFYPIEAEWWHFTLRHQPYAQAFDFPVHADSAYNFSPTR